MARPLALLLFLIFRVTGITFSQPTDPIVTKNISKVISLEPGEQVSITGEKANIQVSGWSKNYIDLKITFSAEHPDKSVATREVEYMHYALSRDKNKVELRNAFILPSNTDHIQSRIKVLIQLMVPWDNTLLLYNKYGDAEIRDMHSKISVGLEFSDLVLNNVTGEFVIQSSFSEIRGEGLSLTSFTAKDEESKYNMLVQKGSYQFTSKHSDIDLILSDRIQSLNIDALHTDITLRLKDFSQYNYNLLSKEGKIYIPERFKDRLEKENNQIKMVLMMQTANPVIKVKTTFNTITLQ